MLPIIARRREAILWVAVAEPCFHDVRPIRLPSLLLQQRAVAFVIPAIQGVQKLARLHGPIAWAGRLPALGGWTVILGPLHQQVHTLLLLSGVVNQVSRICSPSTLPELFLKRLQRLPELLVLERELETGDEPLHYLFPLFGVLDGRKKFTW